VYIRGDCDGTLAQRRSNFAYDNWGRDTELQSARNGSTSCNIGTICIGNTNKLVSNFCSAYYKKLNLLLYLVFSLLGY
jgi:hypothetical protein